ncbi:unnamed protein product [Schistocephalus solidus]|uniref:Uncharacterized protein n=1 Tax=Schistocephalus solidus TaxID=70667 RepID=A0A183S8A3_SCHSO|nr:unnamed protein product [Schistocephalus solidus]
MACVALKRSCAFEVLGPASAKRHRCSTTLPCNCQLPTPKSVFTPAAELTRSQIQRRLREEVKRLQRRRLLPRFPISLVPQNDGDAFGDRPSSPEEPTPPACSSVITSMRSMAIRSPKSDSQTDSENEQNPEPPSPIRLSNRPIGELQHTECPASQRLSISEQYEALLKFNQDQLCHRFQNAPMNCKLLPPKQTHFVFDRLKWLYFADGCRYTSCLVPSVA